MASAPLTRTDRSMPLPRRFRTLIAKHTKSALHGHYDTPDHTLTTTDDRDSDDDQTAPARPAEPPPHQFDLSDLTALVESKATTMLGSPPADAPPNAPGKAPEPGVLPSENVPATTGGASDPAHQLFSLVFLLNVLNELPRVVANLQADAGKPMPVATFDDSAPLSPSSSSASPAATAPPALSTWTWPNLPIPLPAPDDRLDRLLNMVHGLTQSMNEVKGQLNALKPAACTPATAPFTSGSTTADVVAAANTPLVSPPKTTSIDSKPLPPPPTVDVGSPTAHVFPSHLPMPTVAAPPTPAPAPAASAAHPRMADPATLSRLTGESAPTIDPAHVPSNAHIRQILFPDVAMPVPTKSSRQTTRSRSRSRSRSPRLAKSMSPPPPTLLSSLPPVPAVPSSVRSRVAALEKVAAAPPAPPVDPWVRRRRSASRLLSKVGLLVPTRSEGGLSGVSSRAGSRSSGAPSAASNAGSASDSGGRDPPASATPARTDAPPPGPEDGGRVDAESRHDRPEPRSLPLLASAPDSVVDGAESDAAANETPSIFAETLPEPSMALVGSPPPSPRREAVPRPPLPCPQTSLAPVPHERFASPDPLHDNDVALAARPQDDVDGVPPLPPPHDDEVPPPTPPKDAPAHTVPAAAAALSEHATQPDLLPTRTHSAPLPAPRARSPPSRTASHRSPSPAPYPTRIPLPTPWRRLTPRLARRSVQAPQLRWRSLDWDVPLRSSHVLDDEDDFGGGEWHAPTWTTSRASSPRVFRRRSSPLSLVQTITALRPIKEEGGHGRGGEGEERIEDMTLPDLELTDDDDDDDDDEGAERKEMEEDEDHDPPPSPVLLPRADSAVVIPHEDGDGSDAITISHGYSGDVETVEEDEAEPVRSVVASPQRKPDSAPPTPRMQVKIITELLTRVDQILSPEATSPTTVVRSPFLRPDGAETTRAARVPDALASDADSEGHVSDDERDERSDGDDDGIPARFLLPDDLSDEYSDAEDDDLDDAYQDVDDHDNDGGAPRRTHIHYHHGHVHFSASAAGSASELDLGDELASEWADDNPLSPTLLTARRMRFHAQPLDESHESYPYHVPPWARESCCDIHDQLRAQRLPPSPFSSPYRHTRTSWDDGTDADTESVHEPSYGKKARAASADTRGTVPGRGRNKYHDVPGRVDSGLRRSASLQPRRAVSRGPPATPTAVVTAPRSLTPGPRPTILSLPPVSARSMVVAAPATGPIMVETGAVGRARSSSRPVTPVTPTHAVAGTRSVTPVGRDRVRRPTTPGRPVTPAARPVTPGPARAVTPAPRPATPRRPATPARPTTPARPATPGRPSTPGTPGRETHTVVVPDPDAPPVPPVPSLVADSHAAAPTEPAASPPKVRRSASRGRAVSRSLTAHTQASSARIVAPRRIAAATPVVEASPSGSLAARRRRSSASTTASARAANGAPGRGSSSGEK
ncbi:hypothetical protein AMAG_02682 [Allomyces macrogynus ATCC 38327]|uniref:Uncharacterized protein n=1 Tax=Allomyces macrogynus (strain ATCC 38327) TaxID=578462 RepID=A0A0L0S3B9_ALLM3|nr:hypothetical protein AMAG_02682 [Allomyces macrogynus ATCC 38327]|eukprot:KNE56911.1 hypothetical protein AMAG_02682 [Allomyces macrogynus ATCC 38327]